MLEGQSITDSVESFKTAQPPATTSDCGDGLAARAPPGMGDRAGASRLGRCGRAARVPCRHLETRPEEQGSACSQKTIRGARLDAVPGGHGAHAPQAGNESHDKSHGLQRPVFIENTPRFSL